MYVRCEGSRKKLLKAAAGPLSLKVGCVRLCRSMKKRCCSSGAKRLQYRPVEASWSGTHHRPTSPLFGASILSWAFKNSDAGRSWIRSVSSPLRDNLDTTDQFQHPGSNDVSKVHNIILSWLCNLGRCSQVF
jgi:hypothetical protein